MTNEELQKIYVKADMKLDALKDNIHHLAEENKQLKDKIEKLKDYGEKVGERRNELYDKIDKAIEYINNASYFDGSSMCANDLLEILEANNEQ